MADNPHRPYSIDTSCLIESWNNLYQIDVLPSIWEHLDFLLRVDIARITIQVFEEIEKQDDALHDWCKERKDLFTDITEIQIEKLQGVMGRYPRIASKGTRNYADPWVIALAQTTTPSSIIVTEERGGKETNPKIPYVCKKEGLDVYTFNRFLRATGWRENR